MTLAYERHVGPPPTPVEATPFVHGHIFASGPPPTPVGADPLRHGVSNRSDPGGPRAPARPSVGLDLPAP